MKIRNLIFSIFIISSDILISQTTLYCSKSEDNVFLQCEGENPNYIITYSTTPAFQSGNITLNDSNLGTTEITFYSKYSDKDCSGDNFYITAHFTQDGSEVSRSGIITLWNRIYVERDKMFIEGSAIRENASLGQNYVDVYDVSFFLDTINVKLIDTNHQNQPFGEEKIISSLDCGIDRIYFSANLNEIYIETIPENLNNPDSFVGALDDASNPDYYPFYETDLSFIRQAYDPAYVEFNLSQNINKYRRYYA